MIKKGDKVIVIAGKDKGKKTTVLKVVAGTKVILEGVNAVKKHKKPTGRGEVGQIIEKNLPVHISNVMIADPKGGKQTRVGYKQVAGKSVRIAKKSGQEI
ncbi:MAG: 50S ribosomal protein L24 [bacterium]|jgi:large subunit ribosomal protein L24